MVLSVLDLDLWTCKCLQTLMRFVISMLSAFQHTICDRYVQRAVMAVHSCAWCALAFLLPPLRHMRLGRKFGPRALLWYSITQQVRSATKSGSSSVSWHGSGATVSCVRIFGCSDHMCQSMWRFSAVRNARLADAEPSHLAKGVPREFQPCALAPQDLCQGRSNAWVTGLNEMSQF